MSSKRILIFSTAYLPFVGGSEIAIKEITNLLGNDIEFDLITAQINKNLSKIEKIDNVTIYRLGVGWSLWDKFFLPYVGALKAWKLQEKKNYLCFWCVMASYASGSAYIVDILRLLIGKKKVPIVLTLQEGDSEKYLKFKWAGLVDLSWRAALRLADRVTVISSYLASRARRLGYKGELEIIPNGVDSEFFSRAEDKDIKQILGKREDEIFLVTASRLVKKNGIRYVIKAMALLPPNIRFIVVGEGVELVQLLKLARELKVDRRVQFIGHIPYEDIPKYLKASDIFIRPSLSEGFGNSFIEAMAAGLPVIATPVGGIVDFLYDPDMNPGIPPTGLYVQPEDPVTIREQVMRLIENPELKKILVENARKMVEERYQWKLVAQEIKKRVFDKV